MGLDIHFLRREKTDSLKVAEKRDIDGNIIGKTSYYPSAVHLKQLRKTNFLIPFFNYPENKTMRDISRSELEELRMKCSAVVKARSEGYSERRLPTEDGFCFGSIEYDDLYYSKVEEVRELVSKILAETDFDTQVIEMVCWW